MDESTRSILMNKEVIAVDQDAMGVQGFRLEPPPVWVRKLSGGAKALAIFNYVTDDVPQPVTVAFKDLGFSGPVHVRDLWAHKDLGVVRDSFSATPPKGGVVMLRLWQ
jgi:alpha-galactosidase